MNRSTTLIRRSSTHTQSLSKRVCRKSIDHVHRIRRLLPHRHFIHHEISNHSNSPIKHLTSHKQIVKDKYFDNIIDNEIGNELQTTLYHDYLDHINILFNLCHHLNNMWLYKYGKINIHNLTKYNKSNLLNTREYNRTFYFSSWSFNSKLIHKNIIGLNRKIKLYTNLADYSWLSLEQITLNNKKLLHKYANKSELISYKTAAEYDLLTYNKFRKKYKNKINSHNIHKYGNLSNLELNQMKSLDDLYYNTANTHCKTLEYLYNNKQISKSEYNQFLNKIKLSFREDETNINNNNNNNNKNHYNKTDEKTIRLINKINQQTHTN